MKTLYAALAALFMIAHCPTHAAEPLPLSTKIGGFSVGVQAYSFKFYTLFEAIEKTRDAGGKTIEIFLWQKFSPEFPDLEANALMSDEHVSMLQEKLRSSGVHAVSAGSLRNTNNSSRRNSASAMVRPLASRNSTSNASGE